MIEWCPEQGGEEPWAARPADGCALLAILIAAGLLGGCGTSSTSPGANGMTGFSGSSNGGSSGGVVIGGSSGGSGSGAGTSSGGGSGSSGTGMASGPTRPFVFTSAPNAYWQTGTLTTPTGNATVTVNDSTTYQTITGFGGAFNELGWKYLQVLSPSIQADALTLLFDATNGANFLYGRIPIGASDYATGRYTDDETVGDFAMTNFSISQDQQFLIPYVKAALAVNPKIHLWGSAWTPPTWMKTTSGTSGANGTCALMGSTAFDGGCMKSDARTLQAYALYLQKWVQAYGQQGLTIEMVVPQNEPNYAEGYPSCLWSPATFDTFVAQYLGPQFANTSTQVFLGTMSRTSSPGDTDVIAAVLGDSTAKAFIKGFGMQWTMQSGGSFNFGGNSTVASAVSSSHLPIWQTEHQAGNYPWASGFNKNTAPNDFAYGIESWVLIRDWLKAGANSYSAWNMVLDTLGVSNDTVRVWPQNALLAVDTNAKTVIATPAYYVFRHFSQYIQPAATRVATSGSLDTLGFKNPDGSFVTVLYNPGDSAAQTVLSVGGTRLQFTVPASGFATVVK